MSVFRINKTKNYTVMSNYHLQDRNLSYKAKGLLSYMLSLPSDWDYSIKGLVALSKENITSIKSGLKELKINNYLIIDKVFPDKTKSGKIEYRYNIYEIPYNFNQRYENLSLENQVFENHSQINTNIINTKKQIDKDDKPESSFFVVEEHNILTLELINMKYIDKNDIQIFYYDDLFDELLHDHSYKDLIKIIHYITRRIVNNEFRDENNKVIENKFGYLKNAIINNIDKLKINLDELW